MLNNLFYNHLIKSYIRDYITGITGITAFLAIIVHRYYRLTITGNTVIA